MSARMTIYVKCRRCRHDPTGWLAWASPHYVPGDDVAMGTEDPTWFAVRATEQAAVQEVQREALELFPGAEFKRVRL